MTDPTVPSVDPALLRGLTESRLSRRELFRYAGVAGGALGLSAIVAACGTKGTPVANGPKPNANLGTPDWWSKQTLHNQMNFGNWPYYLDVVKATGDHPSLDLFKKQTGITVNYTEPIDDNPSFFAIIRPEIQAGQSIGYDIIVLTNNDFPLGELLDFGWAIPLDQSKMKNFYKYASSLVKNPSWDPGNKYTMAWQSGYTLIAYNTKYIKEPVTSVQQLFDTKYAGKVGMFGNASELGSLGLLAIGVDPVKSTPADWTKAAAKLQQQKDANIVRSYYDQDYIKALQSEDIWISQAWSGDIFQSSAYKGYTTLKAVIPNEGAMFWTDNMLIPIRAENPLDAMTYMDAVYNPQMQALIEDYNAYVSPVPAAKKIIADQLHDPTVANSPTVFPDAHIISLSRDYYTWKNAQDLALWNNTFVPIYQG